MSRLIWGMMALTLPLATSALGASQKDHDDCNRVRELLYRQVNAHNVIAPCTRIIDDRNESASKRAAAHYDRAIADFSEAIRLGPNAAESIYGRGRAKLEKGDVTGGDADIAAAKAISPNVAGNFARHGIAE